MKNRVMSTACSRDVVVTAIKISLVVGTLLVFINHYPALSTGAIARENILQIVLTYMVPYGVSTYSSTAALLRR